MRRTPGALLPLLGLVILVTVSCRARPAPLTVEAGRIVVSNLTPEPWTDIEVWLNGYYKAQAAELPPGGRLDAPLLRFQNGYGRYFDPKREPIREVRASAKTRSGQKLEFRWSPAASLGSGEAGGT